MSQETIQLAEYAANLRFEDIPAEVVQRAKDCIIDTAAAVIYGNTIPWSGTVVGYAQRSGPDGKSPILSRTATVVQPAMAALANGTLSHAFELRQCGHESGRRRLWRRHAVAAQLAMGQDTAGASSPPWWPAPR